MLNVFYLYGGMCLIILLLYSFGWSDLCIPLSEGTIFFVLFMVVFSILCGYGLRKCFKFRKLSSNPHKKSTITLLLVIFYIIDIAYERNIPLFKVLSGQSMYEKNFHGIPILHFFVSGFIFIYCFYLAYLFVCFRKKSLVVEYFASLSLFILLFQRQNIMIVLLGTLWIVIAGLEFKKLSSLKKLLCIVLTIAIILVGLYIFGIMGNARYGLWDSNDASMIMAVGKINDSFPDFIPKSYAWAYIYAISPLSNLQYNISLGVNSNVTFIDIIWHYLPNFVSKNLSVKSIIVSDLLEPSLTVCTAFSDVFKTSGYLGMYIFYLVETAVVIFIILLFNKIIQYRVCAYVSVAYFYLLSFFSNPVIYDITALILIFLIIFRALLNFKNFKQVRCLGVKKIFKE